MGFTCSTGEKRGMWNVLARKQKLIGGRMILKFISDILYVNIRQNSSVLR